MHESGENYLETILILSQKMSTVRSIDVATEMGFSKPSISRAIGILKRDGLIEVDRHGALTLTSSGLSQAQAIYNRHRLIRSFLIDILEVSEETAEIDACRIEHIISEETFERISQSVLKNGTKT